MKKIIQSLEHWNLARSFITKKSPHCTSNNPGTLLKVSVTPYALKSFLHQRLTSTEAKRVTLQPRKLHAAMAKPRFPATATCFILSCSFINTLTFTGKYIYSRQLFIRGFCTRIYNTYTIKMLFRYIDTI